MNRVAKLFQALAARLSRALFDGTWLARLISRIALREWQF